MVQEQASLGLLALSVPVVSVPHCLPYQGFSEGQCALTTRTKHGSVQG